MKRAGTAGSTSLYLLSLLSQHENSTMAETDMCHQYELCYAGAEHGEWHMSDRLQWTATYRHGDSGSHQRQISRCQSSTAVIDSSSECLDSSSTL